MWYSGTISPIWIAVRFFGSELRHSQDIGKDAAKFLSDALDIYLQVRRFSFCFAWSLWFYFILTFHQKLIQRMISTRGILRSVFACDNVAPFVLFIPSENANPSHSILIWVLRGSICLISLHLPASACFCMRCFVAFNSVFTIIRLIPFFVLYFGQSFLPKSTGIHKARRSCNGPFGTQVIFGSFQRRYYLNFWCRCRASIGHDYGISTGDSLSYKYACILTALVNCPPYLRESYFISFFQNPKMLGRFVFQSPDPRSALFSVACICR